METTGKILLSYDVSNKHNDVKTALITLEYSEFTMSLVTNKVYSLPDTTLLHMKKTVSDSISDIQAVCKDLEVKLLSAVSVLTQNETANYNHEDIQE